MNVLPRFGLAGTITYDVITAEGKTVHRGLGGILYQVAVLCAMGYHVNLYTNLGLVLEEKVMELTKNWKTLDMEGVNMVPGPGNRVFLEYPSGGERTEVLQSVVPPIDPSRILQDLPQLDFLVMVLNSGYDMKLSDWKKVKKKAACPVWLDIHSLLLERKIGGPRAYVPVQNWKEWVEGIDYLQANRAEVAALRGYPGEDQSLDDLERFGEEALKLGVKAVFLTLGEEGVLLIEKKEARKIAVNGGQTVKDSTGCGDVFCAGAAAYLSRGRDLFESAVRGMRIASAAVSVCGVASLYHLNNVLFSFE
jgi:sugar/nucleoside kinase (ribokinase family)